MENVMMVMMMMEANGMEVGGRWEVEENLHTNRITSVY
jgi:hypothetical protein